jgi:uncharacterized protein YgiM (DUF1202 family)
MIGDLNFQVRVVESYQAPYPDPIQAKAGDEVAVDINKKTDIAGWVWCTNRAGKSGWVPTVGIEINGDRGRMLRDYNAVELTIHVGEILTVHKTESGFHWVTNQNHQQGWIPIANVEPIGG